ncbi:hemerythrin domain-containing protein [Ideonella sp. BN130291]|uniref:hemerythrin domain-containing protein n=1 Tax=Ideonella sp. BN130291 TaxID=3112940 RepID=UPI002E2537F7|nr:hemerythrin domain-containing protein [Ideonella sp. BN130291]
MNAVDLLIQQHRELEAHFNSALLAGSDAERRAALTFIGDELGVHLSSEEELFYPAVRARRTEDILLESLEEHLSLKRLLADLLVLEPSAPTFEAKFKVLKEQAEHHHKEEEEHLFPKVSKLLSAEENEALGKEMLAMQLRLQAQGEPGEAIAQQTDQAAPLT